MSLLSVRDQNNIPLAVVHSRPAMVLLPASFPPAMDRCAKIAKYRETFDRVMWGGVMGSGLATTTLVAGDRVRDIQGVLKYTLLVSGGVTGIAGVGKFVAGLMLQKCSDDILDRMQAKPTTRAEFDVPDHSERFVSSYAVSAEAIARRVTNPKAVAKGIAFVAAATAVAAVSAALHMVGLRGNVGMESVTPGFQMTLGSEPTRVDRQNTIL